MQRGPKSSAIRSDLLAAAPGDGVEGCDAGDGRHDEGEDHAAGDQAVQQVLQRRGDGCLGVQRVRQHRHQAGADARWEGDLLALRAARASTLSAIRASANGGAGASWETVPSKAGIDRMHGMHTGSRYESILNAVLGVVGPTWRPLRAWQRGTAASAMQRQLRR